MVVLFRPTWGPAHDGEPGWGGMAGLRVVRNVLMISGGGPGLPGILRSRRRKAARPVVLRGNRRSSPGHSRRSPAGISGRCSRHSLIPQGSAPCVGQCPRLPLLVKQEGKDLRGRNATPTKDDSRRSSPPLIDMFIRHCLPAIFRRLASLKPPLAPAAMRVLRTAANLISSPVSERLAPWRPATSPNISPSTTC